MKGIFATKKKAKKFIGQRLREDPLDNEGFGIKRMTVNKPTKIKMLNYKPPFDNGSRSENSSTSNAYQA